AGSPGTLPNGGAADRPLPPEVLVAGEDDLDVFSRSLACNVVILFVHPPFPPRARAFAIAVDASLESHHPRRFHPDAVGKVRAKSIPSGRPSFDEHRSPWLDDDGSALFSSPGCRLVARSQSCRQRLERLFDQRGPPVDWVVPACEVVRVNDGGRP